ncbi:MAG TPA: hypothetical protein VGG29_11610 [Caulobacteraceae bacterium]
MGWRERVRLAAPIVGLILALAAGAALRLSFYGVIEWKADEQWTYDQAQTMAATGVWPPTGMPSSIGSPNPGLSLWVFAGLTKLLGIRSPPGLAGAVQALNVAALLAFVAFAMLVIPKARREPWLWAAALWAANPVCIILERKIWPPSVLPLPMIGFLAAWWFRRHPLAAFAWGALGALMAQIHMGAAFLAFAVALWTLIRDRGGFPWLGWLAGSAVGALPAIPWALAMAAHGAGAHAHHHPSIGYFLRWPTAMFGFDVTYTLGSGVIGDFLAGPRLGGAETHLMLAIYVALIVLTFVVLARGLRTLVAIGALGRRALFLGDSPETTLIAAAFWGYGGLLTLITVAGAGSYRHYMIVVTPILALWTAMAVLRTDRGWRRRLARPILAAVCGLAAALSLGLLAYIDGKGVIDGEFGPSWQAQQQPGRPPPPGADYRRGGAPSW